MKISDQLMKIIINQLILNDELVIQDDQIVYIGESLDTEESINNPVYDETGLSYEMSPNGGFRDKEVDKLLFQWSKGSKNMQTVAKMQAEFYCFLRPGISYPEDIRNQIQANQQRNWMSSGQYGNNIASFYEMAPMYVNSTTNEVLFRSLNGEEHRSKQWVKNKERKLSLIPNHATVANGEATNPDHSQWKEELRDKLLGWVSAKMESDLAYVIGHNPYKPN